MINKKFLNAYSIPDIVQGSKDKVVKGEKKEVYNPGERQVLARSSQLIIKLQYWYG